MPSSHLTWTPYRDDTHSGTYLFKFLSEKFLTAFLQTGKIWFSRADQFGDKMECSSVRDFTKDAFDAKRVLDRQQRNLISCWHLNTNECLAFWDTYAKTDSKRRKYAIRFKKETIVDLIKKAPISLQHVTGCTYGNLSYRNLISANAKSINNIKVPNASMRKDKVFGYEQEFRFVIQLGKGFSKDGVGIRIGNPEQLPFRILVNPMLEKPDLTRCLDILDQLKFDRKLSISKLTKWVKPEHVSLIEKYTSRHSSSPS